MKTIKGQGTLYAPSMYEQQHKHCYYVYKLVTSNIVQHLHHAPRTYCIQ